MRRLTLLVVLVLVFALCAYPAKADDAARFEAETMTRSNSKVTVVSDANASAGKALRFTGNGVATKNAVPFSAAATQIEIRARAVKDVYWPKMRVTIDGQILGTMEVTNTSYATLTSPVNLAAGTHNVQISVVGDTSRAERLFVDSVAFSYAPPPPPPPPIAERRIGVGAGTVGPGDTVLGPGDEAQIPSALAASSPEDPLWLRGGNYNLADSLSAPAGTTPRELRGYPNESPVLNKSFDHQDGDAPVTIDGIKLNTPTSPYASIRWYGDNLTVRYTDITNNHSGTTSGENSACILMGASGSGQVAEGAVLEYSRSHDCGRLNPDSTNRGSHGIYNNNSLGAVIRHNIFDGNSERGIQNYPNPVGTEIYGNVVIGNGYGMIFADNARGINAHNNVVQDSTIGMNLNTGNTYQGLAPGIAVVDTCVYTTGQGAPAGVSLDPPVTETGRLVAQANITGSYDGGDITVTDHDCAAKLPADSPFR
jgi:hypothetical protein